MYEIRDGDCASILSTKVDNEVIKTSWMFGKIIHNWWHNFYQRNSRTIPKEAVENACKINMRNLVKLHNHQFMIDFEEKEKYFFYIY